MDKCTSDCYWNGFVSAKEFQFLPKVTLKKAAECKAEKHFPSWIIFSISEPCRKIHSCVLPHSQRRHNSRRFNFVSWWNIFRQDQCVCYFLQHSFILCFKRRCQEEWFWCNKMCLQTVERVWEQDKPHWLANCVWTDNRTVTGHTDANISVIKRGKG